MNQTKMDDYINKWSLKRNDKFLKWKLEDRLKTISKILEYYSDPREIDKRDMNMVTYLQQQIINQQIKMTYLNVQLNRRKEEIMNQQEPIGNDKILESCICCGIIITDEDREENDINIDNDNEDEQNN